MQAFHPTRAEVARLRRFNRVYTGQLGLLKDRLNDSPFSLPEARVLYELAHNPGETAAGMSRVLNMDRAQLSRILNGLKKKKLVRSEVSPEHAKRRLLSLTTKGRKAFDGLDEATDRASAALLLRFDPDSRRRLLDGCQNLIDVLEHDRSGEPGLRLRDPVPGDIGWVIHRQAVLYAEEYNWDWTYEALISRILGEFIEQFDAEREKAWIAELDDSIVGSIFLKATDDPQLARLRLLYVEPAARGRGIGRALVDACIEQARDFGYARIELWTNSVLVSARRIYEAVGFELVEESPHHSFGQDLLGQTWSLDLGE